MLSQVRREGPSGTARRAGAWQFARGDLAFALLILLHVLPLWVFEYFPSQDGPNHLNNANVIRAYGRPESTAFRQYYVLNKQREANWLGHLILAGLISVAPIHVAEDLFLTGYAVLFPLSVRYALRAIDPEAASLALLAFPFLYNRPLHMGFYSFAYGLPLFFLFVGYFLKRRDRSVLSSTIVLALLSLLLYLFHVVSWTMGAIALVLLTGWQIGVEVTAQARKLRLKGRDFRRIAGAHAAPLLSLVPTALLMARFVALSGGPGTVRPKIHGLSDLYSALLHTSISFDTREKLVIQFLGAGFALLSAYLLASKTTNLCFTNRDGLFLVPAAYLLISLVAPDEMLGGTGLRHRLLLFVLISLILWFGVQPFPRALRAVLVGAAVTASLLLLGLRFRAYAELDGYLREYVSAGRFLAPNTTVLPFCFRTTGPRTNGHALALTVSPFLHATGYIAAQGQNVDFTNYEANKDYFPVRFRQELNPFSKIGDVQYMVRPVDFATYAQRTGGSVDYVLLWWANDPENSIDKNVRASILKQLQDGYERVFVSAPRGLAELYRRKSLTGRSSPGPGASTARHRWWDSWERSP